MHLKSLLFYPSGWGTLGSGGISNKLRKVDVKVISNEQCKNNYGTSITARMLCAEAAGGEGGKGPCIGDTGGPLVTSGPGDGLTPGQNYVLIGVVSWGRAPCAGKYTPAVFAR